MLHELESLSQANHHVMRVGGRSAIQTDAFKRAKLRLSFGS